jgi:hypothetical protein
MVSLVVMEVLAGIALEGIALQAVLEASSEVC